MKFSRTDLVTLVEARPPVPKAPAVTGHEGLLPYERGTVTWIGEVGHWHVNEVNGRRWIKGPIHLCASVRRARGQVS